MDEHTSESIHKAIEALRQIDTAERDAYFKRGEVYAGIKALKPWKGPGYNGAQTWKQFCVGVLGEKEQRVNQCIADTRRFGALSISEGIPVVPSRLSRVHFIKTTSEDQEIELLHKCSQAMPDKDFKTFIREAKGKPHAETCDHVGHGREAWSKCKNCGTWIKQD